MTDITYHDRWDIMPFDWPHDNSKTKDKVQDLPVEEKLLTLAKECNGDAVCEMILKKQADPNTEICWKRNVIHYFIKHLVFKMADGKMASMWSRHYDNMVKCGHDTQSIDLSEMDKKSRCAIQKLLDLGVKVNWHNLALTAGIGDKEMMVLLLEYAKIDVSEEMNGKTVRQIAVENGHMEVAALLEVAEARQNNALLKENNALLKQILKNQEQDRLERAANMEQTKNLLTCIMTYMDCLGATNSSVGYRNAIMGKFRSHLYNSPRTRD